MGLDFLKPNLSKRETGWLERIEIYKTCKFGGFRCTGRGLFCSNCIGMNFADCCTCELQLRQFSWGSQNRRL